MMHFALDFTDGRRTFHTINTNDWEKACDFMLDTRDTVKAVHCHGPCVSTEELSEHIYCADNDC